MSRHIDVTVEFAERAWRAQAQFVAEKLTAKVQRHTLREEGGFHSLPSQALDTLVLLTTCLNAADSELWMRRLDRFINTPYPDDPEETGGTIYLGDDDVSTPEGKEGSLERDWYVMLGEHLGHDLCPYLRLLDCPAYPKEVIDEEARFEAERQQP